jgi:hypothetical protein
VPLALTLPARLRAALPGVRTRRVLGWIAVVVLFAGASVALLAYAAAGVVPNTGTRTLMAGAVLTAGGLLYQLLARRGSDAPPDAVGIFWRRLLLVLGLLIAVEAAPALFGAGAVDGHHMPIDLLTAVGAAFYTVIHVVVAASLLRGLRPLVLARPTRSALRLWRLFLALTLVAALARLVTVPGSPPSFLHFLAAAAVAVVMAACAFPTGLDRAAAGADARPRWRRCLAADDRARADHGRVVHGSGCSTGRVQRAAGPVER